MRLDDLPLMPRPGDTTGHYFDIALVHLPSGNTLFVEKPLTEEGIRRYGRWIVTVHPGLRARENLNWSSAAYEKWLCPDDLTAQAILYHITSK